MKVSAFVSSMNSLQQRVEIIEDSTGLYCRTQISG